jgi:cellulose synthase/poly-beta-1,6-N-acetylglucosamine synthase-like glycosyltransferase
MNWQAIADVAAWFYLVYFAVLGVGSFLLHACSLLEVPRQLEVGLPDLLPRPHSGYEPPVSVVVPACAETRKVTSAVHAFLQLEYPEFEVIVVNDGTSAGTLEALIREFSLVRFPGADRRQIEARHVHGVYRSSSYPNLRVIDKDDGGKADATNAGINAARYPLVCIVDPDSILERTSLRRMVLPFLSDKHTIAAGSCVRVADGCEVRGGIVEEVGLPRKVLPMAQVVEYLRFFLFGRLGWAPLNAVPVVSGEFGVFRKESLVAAGGFRQDAPGEDMELVMRLHRLNRLAGRPYRIAFLVSPVCWKAAPASAKVLREQRIRWQRGLGESVARNRDLLFHRRGGAAGWLMLPFMVVFELLGPLIELSGYLFMVLSLVLGFVSAAQFWSFLLLVVSLGMLLSMSSLLLEEISCHTYRRPGNLLAMACMAIVENFGYHQLVLWWRLQGFFQWATRRVAR